MADKIIPKIKKEIEELEKDDGPLIDLRHREEFENVDEEEINYYLKKVQLSAFKKSKKIFKEMINERLGSKVIKTINWEPFKNEKDFTEWMNEYKKNLLKELKQKLNEEFG